MSCIRIPELETHWLDRDELHGVDHAFANLHARQLGVTKVDAEVLLEVVLGERVGWY